VYANVLLTHDLREAEVFRQAGFAPLVDSTPVLCASCHASNALGASGKPGVSSMSNAMHGHHAALALANADPGTGGAAAVGAVVPVHLKSTVPVKAAPAIPATTEGCQSCHPGP